MDSSTKLSDQLNLDFLELKSAYFNTIEKIVPLLPALLSLIDFSSTGDFQLTSERMKEGYYGQVVGGQFIAPLTGPYVGFLTSINNVELNKIKELLTGVSKI